MKPKLSPCENPQGELFRVELTEVINLDHPLVRLADEIDWRRFDEVFGASYSEDSGRPAISTRLMVALHYLKYLSNAASTPTPRRVRRRRLQTSFPSTTGGCLLTRP